MEDSPDPFVGTPEVFEAPGAVYEQIRPGLSNHLLFQYLRTKDAVMVFFYEHNDPVSQQLRPTVKEAAQTTQRPNHAYVAVNCKINSDICNRYRICSVPYFKLFSKGRPMGSYKQETTAADLKRFVETTPVYEGYCKSLPAPGKLT
ncbi:hypothetical protein BsWGS_28331 [Bradybaena similaris]